MSKINKLEQMKREVTLIEKNKIEKNKIEKNKKEDSSDISSYDSDDDNLTNEDIQKEARQNYVQTELLERITKYLKIDNAIKEKQKELREYMKSMKTQKQDMEKYIIGYLTEVKEEYIKIDGEGKLTKTISTSKGAIKVENIKVSIMEGLQKQNIKLNEKQYHDLIGSILTSVEDKRPKTNKTYIKRTQVKKQESDTTENKKQDKTKQDKTKQDKTKQDKTKQIKSKQIKSKELKEEYDSSDEELPKYY